MPQHFEALVRHLRLVAVQIENLDAQASKTIESVADHLGELFHGRGDVLAWLDSEQEFQRATECIASILDQRADRNLAEAIRELSPALRDVRATTLRKRFPDLADDLVAGPASVLRYALAGRLVRAK